MSKDFNAEEESVIVRMLQAVAVPVLGNVCHVFMNGLNRVQVCGIPCFMLPLNPLLLLRLELFFCARIDLSCYLLLQVYGLEKLHDALLRRPKEKSLITV